jgi:predicted ATPase
VLDNCEHLIAECARVADVLLRTAPGLKILASSREALGIGGELAWHVPSLTVPEPKQLPVLAELRQYEAVRLFVERAAFAMPAFKLSEASAPTVVKICQRLDGIPLAIELAAARVKALPIESIATRLDDRFRLLTGGSRTALPRQQTLRALIDWSYSLLSEPERILLRRVSVFAGGWTLEAAEEVCAGDSIGTLDVLDLLTHLVDKSLVVLDAEPARYRLLETIRQYAREKLLDSGEGAQMRTQHLAFYVRLGEQFSSNMFGPNHSLWSNRFETEHDNFRTAIEWSLEGNDALSAMRFAAALQLFWQQHHTAEGLDRLHEILDRSEAMGRTQTRARALYSLGYLEALHGNSSVAPDFLKEAIAIATEAGDEGTVASCFRSLAVAAIRRKDNIAARSFVTQALEICRRVDDQEGIAFAFNSLGDIAQSEEDLERAEANYLESVSSFRRVGSKGTAVPLRKLGLLAVRHGDYASARTFIRESLNVNIELGDKRGIACCLVAAAGLRVARGQLLDAGRLCGAAAALLDAIHTQMFQYDQEQNERNLAALRAQFDPAAFDAALDEGRALTLELAVALGLEESHD